MVMHGLLSSHVKMALDSDAATRSLWLFKHNTTQSRFRLLVRRIRAAPCVRGRLATTHCGAKFVCIN